MDSPRGRIHLMAALEDGSLELTDTVAEHFDRCLGCMACVSACPSGVRYDRLIEQTRVLVEERRTRPLRDRVLRSAIFAVLPHRRRLRLRACSAPVAGAAPASERSRRWRRRGRRHSGRRCTFPVAGRASRCSRDACKASSSATSTPRPRGYWRPTASTSTCRRRRAAVARCALTRGAWREGVAARPLLATALSGYDHIVTNAAGCGSHLKDHAIAGVGRHLTSS